MAKGSVASTVAPGTYGSYAYITKKYLIPELGGIKLWNLKPQHLQRLYADKLQQGLSPRSVQLMHITLHKALKNAIKTGLISRNPIDLVDPPKVERHEMKTMTEEDIGRFLDEARKGDYYTLFYIYLFTGIRRSEALALRWSDVDLLGSSCPLIRLCNFYIKKSPSNRPRRLILAILVALSPSTSVVQRLIERHKTKSGNIKRSPQYRMMTWFSVNLTAHRIYQTQLAMPG